jgi:hypothetical protein
VKDRSEGLRILSLTVLQLQNDWPFDWKKPLVTQCHTTVNYLIIMALGQWTLFKQRVFSGLSNEFQIACVPTGNTEKKEILASLVDSDALVESDQVLD